MTFRDATGTSTTCRGTFRAGSGADVYLSALQSLVGLFSAVSDCAIVRYAVTFRAKDTSPGTPRNAQPPISLARFIFQLSSDSNRYDSVLIPLKEDWIAIDGPLAGYDIPTSNADVTSLGAAIGNYIFTNPFGELLGDLFSVHVETTV